MPQKEKDMNYKPRKKKKDKKRRNHKLYGNYSQRGVRIILSQKKRQKKRQKK